jgi:hypothetical protein
VENIILFLALFTGTATAVQLSLFRQWWLKILLSAAIALFTYLFYPTAIQFSSTDIENLLASETAMLNLSVVLVLEAAVMLILALFMLRDMYTKLVMPWKLVPLLQYLPMASSVGVLCFYQVFLYQQGLAWEFETTALVYGGGVALGVLVFAWLIQFLIPLRLLRLELKLAMHAAQILLAIAISVLTATYPYRGSEIEPNLLQFAVVVALFFGGALFGYRRYRIHTDKLLAGS